jgi:curved DNA-binding protein CbpA
VPGNVYTLRARCATWGAVESFYRDRVLPGGLLAARVPFVPQPGDRVALALELPDEVVMAIDGVVRKVGESDGHKTPIVVRLVGFGEKTISRLRAMVAEGRGASGRDRRAASSVPIPASRARSRRVRPPPPRPEDAPVNIAIATPAAPDPSALDEPARGVYDRLVAELERLSELDAAAVVGCEPGAELEAVRRAYFERVKELHPDVLARHRSAAIGHAAQELFIFVNRAYDRLRSAARVAGRGQLIGSALRGELGWVIDVGDLGGDPGDRALSAADLFRDVDDTAPRGDAAVALTGGEPAPGGAAEPAVPLSELVAEAGAAAERGDFDRAAELYAEALGLEPRDRKLRARYHAARGRQLIGQGDRVRATTQLELALSHDPDNADAAAALADIRGGGRRKRRSRLSRWLKGER